MIKTILPILSIAVVVSLPFAPATPAEEGMWTPAQMPELGPALASAGLQLSADVLSDLTRHPMNAVISLGGRTAERRVGQACRSLWRPYHREETLIRQSGRAVKSRAVRDWPVRRLACLARPSYSEASFTRGLIQ